MEFKPLIKIRLRSLHGVEIVFTLVHCESQVSRSGSQDRVLIATVLT